MRYACGTFIAVLAVLCPSAGCPQPPAITHESFHFEDTPRTVKLRHGNIISNTVEVLAAGRPLSKDEYLLDVPSGTIKFLANLDAPLDMEISYGHLWFDISSCFLRRRLADYTAEAKFTGPFDGYGAAVPYDDRPRSSQSLEIFGSKSIGLRTGTGSNLELSQTLNVSIDGYLSPNLRVTGVLSDQSRPEVGGISTTLGEIDKVTLQVASEKFTGTVGDIDFERDFSAGARVKKALKGGSARFRSNGIDADAVVGGIRSRNGRLKTFGIEGVSGPYRLLPDVGQASVSILPGTDRVWLDGREAVRGTDADYQIDYVQGQITFSPWITITSRSRIEADFEYLDEGYRQDFQAASFRYGDTANAVSAEFGLISQIDSKGNPSQFALADSDILILAEAGDAARQAVRSGVVEVEPGKGDYIRRVVGSDTVYVHVGSLAGDYRVSFSYFGPGNGDYEYLGGGAYRFVSKNGGAYLPMIRLPMPQRSDVMSLSAMVRGSAVSCRIDGLVSNHDRNLFSDEDDDDNTGSDVAGRISLIPLAADFADDLGWQIEIQGRRSESDFSVPGRAYRVDRDRMWGLPSDSVFHRAEELLISQNLAAGKAGKVVAEWGTYRDRGFLSAGRYSYQATVYPLRGFSLSASRDDRASEDLRGRLKSRLYENRLRAGLSRSGVSISAGWSDETDRRILNADSTGRASDTYSADISFAGLTSRFAYENRDIAGNSRQREYDCREASIGYSGSGGLSKSATTLYVNHRRIHYLIPRFGKQSQFGASLDYQAGSHKDPFDILLNYRISRQGVDRTTESFIRLGEGEGDYRFEEGVYVPDPLGDYIRVVEVLTVGDVGLTVSRGLRLRIDPGCWRACPGGLAFLRKLLLETHIRISEQGDPGTPAGLRWMLPYVEVFRGGRFNLDRSFRQTARATLSSRLSIFLSCDELKREDLRLTPASTEYTIALLERAEINLSPNTGFSIEHRLKRQNQSSPSLGNARFVEHQISGLLRHNFATGLTVIPKIGYLLDRSKQDDLSVSMRETALELNQRVAGAGRIGSEIAYQHVSSSRTDRFIPFQYARGRRPGDNFQWRISAEFGLSRNISARLSYEGQKIPQIAPPGTRHASSLSIRARF